MEPLSRQSKSAISSKIQSKKSGKECLKKFNFSNLLYQFHSIFLFSMKVIDTNQCGKWQVKKISKKSNPDLNLVSSYNIYDRSEASLDLYQYCI